MILLRATPSQYGSDSITEARVAGEDEEVVAAILASRLNSLGWDVCTSASGEDFVTVGEEDV